VADKNPKNIIHVEITDSVGDGGTFYGDHIVVGHPFEDPPSNWEHGQLLFDGNEEDAWAGDGDGGGGPHEHTQYAQIAHDHDYLPLEGGTLTGDLTVEDLLTLASETSNPLMLVNMGATRVGYFGVPGTQAGIDRELWLRSDKALILQGVDGVRLYQSDLTVDGSVSMGDGKAVYFGGNWEGGRIYNTVSANREYMVLGNGGVGAQINLYGMNDDISKGNILFYAGEAEGGGARTVGRWDGPTGMFIAYRDAEVRGDLQVDGKATINAHIALPNARTSDTVVTNAPNLYLTSSGNVRFTTFSAAPKAFNIADGIDTADVLERAEVATMPAPDDEGVATTDADVDSLTVNEVVTALLAKVKELSTEIKELKGA
jgi:hypothetical protein